MEDNEEQVPETEPKVAQVAEPEDEPVPQEIVATVGISLPKMGVQ